MFRLGQFLGLRRPKENDGPSPPVLPWSLDAPLFHFSGHFHDTWRIRDACEGPQVFGATGSGKTSGSGRALARLIGKLTVVRDLTWLRWQTFLYVSNSTFSAISIALPMS